MRDTVPTTPQVRQAILRLMRYAIKATTAKYDTDVTRLYDLRTSADDCRIAIRAARGEYDHGN